MASNDDDLMQVLASGGAPRSPAEEVGAIVPTDVVRGSGQDVVFAGPGSLPSGRALSALLDGMLYTGAERRISEALWGSGREPIAFGADLDGGPHGMLTQEPRGFSPFHYFDFVMGESPTLPSELPRELVSSILRAEEAFQARGADPSRHMGGVSGPALGFAAGGSLGAAVPALGVSGMWTLYVLLLKAQLGSDDWPTRHRAQRILESLPRSPELDLLLKANLSSEDPEIRWRAGRIIAYRDRYPITRPITTRAQWEANFETFRRAKAEIAKTGGKTPDGAAEAARDELRRMLTEALETDLIVPEVAAQLTQGEVKQLNVAAQAVRDAINTPVMNDTELRDKTNDLHRIDNELDDVPAPQQHRCVELFLILSCRAS